MTKTYVIVGGVAGGMSAATRLRRLAEDATIIVLERSGYVSFANCGLPYYVGGVIAERDALLLQTPASLAARFGIDVRVESEVTAIDAAAHTVSVTPAAGEPYELSYDALVLAPGAAPVRPPIAGAERALSLRDVEDVDALAAAASNASSAVVVGGGFIGVEVAENLRHLGLDVTLVEAASQILAPFDEEMVIPLQQRMRDHGVTLMVDAAVAGIGEQDVTLADGRTVPADLVVMSIGVRPDGSLAQAAGATTDERGAIIVDEQLRTNLPDVYAVGDAVAKRDAVDGSLVHVPLANTANLQGRQVADIIVGRASGDRPVLAPAIVGVFGAAAASVGWNEKRLRAAGRTFRAIHTHPASHAGYYPGAKQLSLKLLVDSETDAILGAQAIGEDGADKRIDVLATAIRGGLTASDLADLELAYAPAYGSAKDPINMLGFINRNLREGLTDNVDWSELAGLQATGVPLIDVRTPGEHAAGAIPGAINIPVDELRDRLAEVPQGAAPSEVAENGEVMVHCAVGLRGYLAARILNQAGYHVRNLDGGYKTWASSPAAPDES